MKKSFFCLTALGMLALGAHGQTVDAQTTLQKALEGTTAPQSITSRLVLLDVEYYGTDSLLHRGQIVVDSAVAADVEAVFGFARSIRYPIETTIPIKFDLPNNGSSMSGLNNSYGFHYRRIVGGKGLSIHSYGRAFDLNPFQNPLISSSGRTVPAGAAYDPKDPRTLTADHPLVAFAESLGWTWGGRWSSPKDYMHFEKPIR